MRLVVSIHQGTSSTGDIGPFVIDGVVGQCMGVAVEINAKAAALKQGSEVEHVHLVDGMVADHNEPVAAGNGGQGGLQPIVLCTAVLRQNIRMKFALS